MNDYRRPLSLWIPGLLYMLVAVSILHPVYSTISLSQPVVTSVLPQQFTTVHSVGGPSYMVPVSIMGNPQMIGGQTILAPGTVFTVAHPTAASHVVVHQGATSHVVVNSATGQTLIPVMATPGTPGVTTYTVQNPGNPIMYAMPNQVVTATQPGNPMVTTVQNSAGSPVMYLQVANPGAMGGVALPQGMPMTILNVNNTPPKEEKKTDKTNYDYSPKRENETIHRR